MKIDNAKWLKALRSEFGMENTSCLFAWQEQDRRSFYDPEEATGDEICRTNNFSPHFFCALAPAVMKLHLVKINFFLFS